MFKASMMMQLTTNPDTANEAFRRTAGWTESWYSGESSPSRVAAVMQEVMRRRAILLPASGAIVGIRVQQVNPTGPSQSFPVALKGLSIQTDIPQMTLLCRAITADGLNSRRIELAGIPDARVVNGEYSPTSNFEGALENYFTAVRGVCLMKGRNRSLPVVPLVSVDAGGLATFAAAHGMSVNDQFTFFRTRTITGKILKGTWRVATVPSALTLTIANWKGGIVENGGARKLVIGFPSLLQASIFVERITTRKVGSPFFRFRGRASKRS